MEGDIAEAAIGCLHAAYCAPWEDRVKPADCRSDARQVFGNDLEERSDR